MDRYTGPDPGLAAEVTADRDTLNTVLACLSLLRYYDLTAIPLQAG